MKYVKFAGSTVGVVAASALVSRSESEITFHNGVKLVHRFVENRALTEITAAEFELSVRKKGQTSMLQYLALTTFMEVLVWHSDPKDLPEPNRRCLVFVSGGSGPEGRAVFTGKNWRMNDGYRYEIPSILSWAYEPQGPK